MNLTCHLVVKDLRHLRGALSLWIALLVGQVWVTYRLVSNGTDNFDWFQHQGMLNALLMGLGMMLTYLLIGMLVLEDPVAGEKMAWATRPIRGGRLLTAKVITASLLFGVLPLLARAPWWMLCDFSFGGIVDATVRMICLQLCVAVPAFAVASLATSVGRFLLMSVLLAMGLVLAQMNLMGNTMGASDVSHALQTSRVLVAMAVSGMTGIIGTIMMYRTRNLGRGATVFGIGLSLAVLAGAKFPVELTNPFFRMADKAPPLENSSSMEVKLGSVQLEHDRNKGPMLVVSVWVLNLPEELGLYSGEAELTLQWTDGTVFRCSSLYARGVRNDSLPLYRAFGLKEAPSHWDPETAAKDVRFNEERIERLSRQGYARQKKQFAADRSEGLTESFPVPDEIVARLLKESPEYRMTVKIVTGAPEVLGEISPKPGSVITRHARIELLNFTQHIRPESKQGWGEQSRNGTFSILQPWTEPKQVVFCYVDRRHQEVKLLNTNQAEPIPSLERLRWVGFDFPAPQLWRTDRWIEVPEWEKDFKIGVVIYKPKGTFERSLKGKHFAFATRESPED